MMQITTARRRTQRLITMMQQTVGTEMAMSILLSRVSREARRLYGLDGAQHLFRHLAAVMPDGDQAEAIVPNAAFQLGRRERTVWDVAGMMVQTVCAAFPAETAFHIILSSAHATKPMINAMIATMPQVSQYDV